MLVGIPTEIKNNEYRVAITPGGVAELTRRGHDVIVQAGAGNGSAIDDRDFKAAGAEIVGSAAQVGAYHVMKTQGGRGVLMGGVPGVAPADVVVIGGGTAGYNAARVAAGMGAHVTVFDVNMNKLREVDAEFGGRIETRYSSMLELEDAVKKADL